jgi:hypothetical protein
MIINLLVITLLLSLVVAGLVAWFFRKPISTIMNRIVGDPLASAWVRYVMVAIVVVGVGGGVRPWDYEKYITLVKDQPLPVLTDIFSFDVQVTYNGRGDELSPEQNETLLNAINDLPKKA